MRAKSPKQELNVNVNPDFDHKEKPEHKKQLKTQKPQPIVQEQKPQKQSQLPYPSPQPKKREQLKKVQDDIELMRNKILLLKIQLQKEQESIKMNKSRTEQVIRKKINVNKIQKYKFKDTSADLQRAQQLRLRNASIRQSHQSQMQNIFKAIYLVKLDDAREIKNLSQSHRKKIMQMNEATCAEQIEKKKKIAEDQQRAKEKYERYWKEKLISVYEGENKVKGEVQRTIHEKKDELKELRQQEIKLLESMNKVQVKQMETKKQYLAALSLPVKDVAQALNRSKSSLDQSSSKDKTEMKLNRMSSQISKTKHENHSQMVGNFSSMSNMDQLLPKDNPQHDRFKQFKLPNSTVNKQKLKIILKELKRLQKKEKQSTQVA